MLTTTTWGNRRRGLRRAAAALCLLIGAGGGLALGSTPALADSGPLPSTLFSYPDFTAPSGPGLNLIASAQISASALQLDGNTDVGPNTGAAWYANQVDVQSSWESQFTYQVPASGGAPEGLAFVIQGQSAAADGEGGPNLGFAGITHSLAVEIGLTSNAVDGEPAAPFISIQTGGAGQNSASSQDSIGVNTGSVSTIAGSGQHTITVLYAPPLGTSSGVLEVYLDDILQPVVVVRNLDLGTKLGLTNGQAWVGLTAASGTGSNTETADIDSWLFQPRAASELAVASPAVSGPAGAQATLGPVTVSLESCGAAPTPCAGEPVDATADLAVSLQSSSPGGVFAATSGGPPVTSVTIPAGATSATFFYGDTEGGSPVITATPQATGVDDATQTETISPPPLVPVTATVTGAQTFGSSSPAFTQTNNAPSGVTVSGSVSCTTVNGGTAIGPSMAASGSYTIDGSSCSGLSVPAGDTLSYTR